MKIRLDTSKAKGIRNQQDHDISGYDLNRSKQLEREYPRAKRRSKPSALFNCHGLTFACRRTKITEREVLDQILTEDHWTEIKEEEALPADIVIYYDDSGDPSHSGVVTSVDELVKVPNIVSKWGSGPEFIHSAPYVPPIYGITRKYYRCNL